MLRWLGVFLLTRASSHFPRFSFFKGVFQCSAQLEDVMRILCHRAVKLEHWLPEKNFRSRSSGEVSPLAFSCFPRLLN